MEQKYFELAKYCGVVGAGGAGFPTQIKLNATVDYLVINGAECEPLMTVDQVLILHFARQLVKTLEGIQLEVGAKEVIIGIKAKHAEVIAAVRAELPNNSTIRVEPLGDNYPAGDEYVLVYETTGRQISHGGIPLDCGVVVMNVETLMNLSLAEQGQPVTQKWVTVAGEVADPATYRVPLGVSIGEMLTLAGGPTISDYSVINGGPMMGKLVGDLSEPVTKTTKGLLVLPKENPVIVNLHRPLERIVQQAQSICCQCQLCSDLCPRGLLGYQIHPNKIILAASYGFSGPGKESFTEAFMCSECGACDMYACPMGLSPRRVNQMLKNLLAREKTPNPYKGRFAVASQWRPYRRIPSKRLVSRLALTHYQSPAVWNTRKCEAEFVTLPLRQHIGAPSQPVVHSGERVEEGQLIAQIPEGSAVSSNLFASINGEVREVTQENIVIEKRRGKGDAR